MIRWTDDNDDVYDTVDVYFDDDDDDVYYYNC